MMKGQRFPPSASDHHAYPIASTTKMAVAGNGTASESQLNLGRKQARRTEVDLRDRVSASGNRCSVCGSRIEALQPVSHRLLRNGVVVQEVGDGQDVDVPGGED